MVLRELIQRAVAVARPGDPISQSVAEQTAEPLLITVFAAVGNKLAGNERTRSQLRRTKILNFVGGPVLLPTDVLSDYIDTANLLDPTDFTKIYSLAPWDQFTSTLLDQRLGYFALEGEGVIHVVEPFTFYNPAAEPTVLLNLTVPCVPVIPLAITDPVPVTDEVAEELVTALAQALRAAIK